MINNNPELQEYTSLAPVVYEDPQILILVSMPSVDSHLANFYYADRSNRFWPTLSALYHMPAETEEQQREICKVHHLALWSVVKSCLRHLSEEDTMQDVQLNNIQGFLDQYPTITKILCVSHDAENLVKDAVWDTNVEIGYLPSPSAADLWYDSVEKLLPRYAEALGVEE